MKEKLKPFVEALDISQEAKDELNAFFDKKLDEILVIIEETKTLLYPHREAIIRLVEKSELDDKSTIAITNLFKNLKDL